MAEPARRPAKRELGKNKDGNLEDALRHWLGFRSEREELIQKLKRVNQKIGKLEENFPYIGTIKGRMRRDENEGVSPEKKEKKSTPSMPSLKYSGKQLEHHRKLKQLENFIRQKLNGGKVIPREKLAEYYELSKEFSGTVPNDIMKKLVEAGKTEELFNLGISMEIGDNSLDLVEANEGDGAKSSLKWTDDGSTV